MVTVSGDKYYEAKRWNADHATIEVKPALSNMSEVAGYFRDRAAVLVDEIQRQAWNWGDDHPVVQRNREIMRHYEAVAAAIGA